VSHLKVGSVSVMRQSSEGERLMMRHSGRGVANLSQPELQSHTVLAAVEVAEELML